MKKSILNILFLVLGLLYVSCNARAQSSTDIIEAFSQAGLPLLRQTIPARNFSLSLVSGTGENVSLDDLKGKVVFLNFWATWCPPCRDEMPSMESLYRRFKDKGLEILAVNLREEEALVTAFMRDYNLSFPALLDSNGRTGSAYGIQVIPTSFIIDREGNIILRLIGSIDWNTPEIQRAMEMLLNQ